MTLNHSQRQFRRNFQFALFAFAFSPTSISAHCRNIDLDRHDAQRRVMCKHCNRCPWCGPVKCKLVNEGQSSRFVSRLRTQQLSHMCNLCASARSLDAAVGRVIEDRVFNLCLKRRLKISRESRKLQTHNTGDFEENAGQLIRE